MSTAESIFISCVSAEFRIYREALRRSLDSPNVTVKVQEDFIATGTETLDKLDLYIKQCDAVIHLVGDMTGALAKPPSVSVIRHRYPDFSQRLPPICSFLQLNGPALSYTQWEAWLALYHSKGLIITVPDESAVRERGYIRDEAQRRAQLDHLTRLASVERFPEITFSSADRLAIEILRSHRVRKFSIATKISQATWRNAIPYGEARFIGREREQAELRETILNHCLVTVTGAPGIGKTSLMMKVARSLEPQFEEIIGVPLSQLQESSAIPLRIANTLGIKGQPGKDIIELICESLKQGKKLLILDSCEAVICECAELVSKLKVLCTELQVVLTSRIVLGISSEHVYRVPPLKLPDPEHLPGLEALAHIDSVELLLTCLKARSSPTELTEDNAKKVAHLCCNLSGLPLAVELVAAQMEILDLDAVLEQRTEWLDFSRDDVAQVEQEVVTLRNIIRWSYNRLGCERDGEKCQALFRRLSVFKRGWTIEGAHRTCGEPNETELDISKQLKSLRRASLIEAKEVAGENRFWYLDPIRDFALTELESEGLANRAATRHARWVTEFAECWQPRLLTNEQSVALLKLIAEADNFRVAFQWACHYQDAQIALRLTSALWRLMEIKGFYSEGAEYLHKALEIQGAKKFPLLRAKALGGLAILAYRRGDLDTTEHCSRQRLVLERKHGTSCTEEADALSDLGLVAMRRGKYQKALGLYAKSLKIHQAKKNERYRAVCLFNIGALFMSMGKLDKAEDNVKESLNIFEETGNRREAAFALNTLGLIERYRGQYEVADRFADRSLEIRKSLEDRGGMAETMVTKADILIGKRHFDAALHLLVKSGNIFLQLNNERGVSEALEQLASLATDQDFHPKAVILFAAADELRKKLGVRLPPIAKRARDARIECLRNALGNTGFNVLREKGRVIPPREAFALGVDSVNNSFENHDEKV